MILVLSILFDFTIRFRPKFIEYSNNGGSKNLKISYDKFAFTRICFLIDCA